MLGNDVGLPFLKGILKTVRTLSYKTTKLVPQETTNLEKCHISLQSAKVHYGNIDIP